MLFVCLGHVGMYLPVVFWGAQFYENDGGVIGRWACSPWQAARGVVLAKKKLRYHCKPVFFFFVERSERALAKRFFLRNVICDDGVGGVGGIGRVRRGCRP